MEGVFKTCGEEGEPCTISLASTVAGEADELGLSGTSVASTGLSAGGIGEGLAVGPAGCEVDSPVTGLAGFSSVEGEVGLTPSSFCPSVFSPKLRPCISVEGEELIPD